MTRVEKAKSALWGELIDSGELREEDATSLLNTLVDAAKEEERERIRNVARPLNRVYELGEGEALILLATDLVPREEEK